MASGANRKVIKYRKPLNINIGMIIYGIIFIYLVISVILYAVSPKISVYEVKKGSLAKDNTYTGMALRQERIVTADKAGYVNFYAREGEKIGTGQTVYTVDETGKLSELLADSAASESTLSDEDIRSLRTEISGFANIFNAKQFNEIYSFKNEIQNSVLELINLNMLSSLNELGEEGGGLGGFAACTAPEEGILVYSTDGYEEHTPDTLTEEMFNQENYNKTILKSAELVNPGDVVYKLITDENWSVVIPLSEETAEELAERTVVKIRFKKDNAETKAGINIIHIEGKPYGRLELNNSCIRYAADRFINIELLLDVPEGLKIPVSSVIEKQFYTIPKDYAAQGGDSSEVGFILETYNENGAAEQKFVNPTIYYSTEEDYYVDTREFEIGSYLIKMNSTDRYQIGKTAALTGVYNINKGYAVFKQVNKIFENEEYLIVEEGTTYGLAVYDHIVMDGTAVDEDDIIY